MMFDPFVSLRGVSFPRHSVKHFVTFEKCCTNFFYCCYYLKKTTEINRFFFYQSKRWRYVFTVSLLQVLTGKKKKKRWQKISQCSHCCNKKHIAM